MIGDYKVEQVPVVVGYLHKQNCLREQAENLAQHLARMLDMLETVNQRNQSGAAGVHQIAGFIESPSKSRSWDRGDCVCEV